MELFHPQGGRAKLFTKCELCTVTSFQRVQYKKEVKKKMTLLKEIYQSLPHPINQG